MIPFYVIKYDKKGFETPELKLARQMGQPPFKTEDVNCSESVSDFIRKDNSPLAGIIFDPYFWYSQECWMQWVDAVLKDGSDGKINVPLGNQDPTWRNGLNIRPYLTVSGLEQASGFKSSVRWIIREKMCQEMFSVIIVPQSLLKMLPQSLCVGEIPEYFTKNPQEYRIFCEGWLHSFNALKKAGCRHDLLSMCHWEGMVLELGCDKGLMAKTCKKQGTDICWVGVDYNQNALLKAESYLDMALCADIHSLPFPDHVRFDRIVCGDVLEHLPYPWEVLKRLNQWMHPDGLLVASVPNIGHWTIVEDLLSGRFDEAPSGILCVSHLRHGTKKNWERWFCQSGMQIIRWESEKHPLPAHWDPVHLKGYNLESLETIRYRVVAKSM